ncbi:conserved unknown protein [Ectocarpus siliculosus]|uniref:Uncharacterized protein n=1 Tax=Ectocarpus siliculosus TaxID=2880 RepID=D7G2S4_ECTSI|nr:conserved unknown protein [Ectocarpus siliculosus]|eukprot:CBJ26899.1 conserved unknown protein [Ectocarpus siliculosus]
MVHEILPNPPPTRPHPRFFAPPSAFLVSVARPRVRDPRRVLLVGALLERNGHSLVTARWRHGTHRPAAGVRGSQRTPLSLPTQNSPPLSTLDRHSSAFSPQHPQEPDLLPVARSPNGHLRNDIKIILTKEEDKLFKTLLEMVEKEKMGTTLRVAGGWVRDKLVGQEQGFHQRHLSKVNKMDIDIALDNCMGGDFAARLNRYLSRRKSDPGARKRMSKVALIASNPEKSKHLETATLRIDNFWVDFVNLRTESYVQDSRIPSINIGTPMEDSFRRDLTINSLFYNVNTGTVEDYTGKGTSDLRLGLVRTPLPPCETLLDDPLRALRAVRFASRLGFRVHPELMEAGRDPKVHEALCMKVSRERVGCELDQMVRSASPLRAFELMEGMKILPMVFPLPEGFVLPMDDDVSRAYEFGMVYLKNMFHLLDREQTVLDDFNAFGPGVGDEGVQEEEEEVSPAAARERLKGVKATAAKKVKGAEGKVKGGGSKKAVGAGTQRGKAGITVTEGMDKEEMRRLGLYAAFLLPLADSMCPNQKRANVPLIQVMMADYLKLRAKDPQRVLQLQSAAMDFQLLLRKTARGPLTRANSKPITFPRLAPGLTMRAVGPLWRVALVLGLTGDLGTKHILDSNVRDRGDKEEDAAVIAAYMSMAREIESMGLEGVWDLKPMFNGGEVKKILPEIPRGPVFSKVMDDQIKWMIANPEGTKEEGLEYIKARYERFC